tara:strand:- start:8 stop:550 length:543 start_codon:yes stop_codon:yes gene_type:complete
MKDYLIGITRAYPLITILSSFIGFFLTNKDDLLFLGTALIINDRLNGVFKNYLFKPILGNKNNKLLGLGKRPNGAKNCGYFINSNSKPSTTYGMPSGHSQSTLFFSTYVILNLLDNNFSNNVKIIGILLFTLISLGIMYSRIYFNCHTIQQVIIGGIIGIILGYLYYQNEEKIKNILYNL